MKKVNVVLSFTTKEGELEYVWYRPEVIETDGDVTKAINDKGMEILKEFSPELEEVGSGFYWGSSWENAHRYDNFTIIESEQSFIDINKFL
jgi:hypothetical protein